MLIYEDEWIKLHNIGVSRYGRGLYDPAISDERYALVVYMGLSKKFIVEIGYERAEPSYSRSEYSLWMPSNFLNIMNRRGLCL